MKCFKCDLSGIGTISCLFRHYRLVHGLASAGSEVRCIFPGCPRVFMSMGKLKSHVSLKHNDSLSEINDLEKLESYCDEGENVKCGDNNSDEDVEVCDDADQFRKPEIDLVKSFMTFTTSLIKKANMTQSNVQMVTENLQGLLEDVKYFAEETVRQLCKDVGLDEDSEAKCKAFSKLSIISSALSTVSTTFKRHQWLSDNGYFIPPQEIVLGTREEQRFSAKGGGMRIVRIEETYQVIPLPQLLAKIIEQSNSNRLIRDFTSCDKSSQTIRDYMFTKTYQMNDFFQRHPHGLVLHFFVDAYETTNPLGSHTYVHKLEGLYCIIVNVPPEYNSKLSSIFLLALWYAADVEKYGYDKILRPIVDQLKELESEDGVRVVVDGEFVQIHAILGMFSADNLGAHSLFGFLESFSANQFCRFCSINKTDSQTCFSCDPVLRRTKERYNESVSLIDSEHYNSSETGIKRGCVLNELQYFHCVESSMVDCMHDLLEGIIPNEIAATLQSLIAKQFISLIEVNQILIHFPYSLSDRNSKPPEITLPSLRIQAAEAWTLLRNLPLMIGAKVPRDDPHWRLIILLCDCCAIIFAPEITESMAHYLAELLNEHHTLFKELYPDKNLLPKHHFILHYPEFLIKFGPLCRYWCMRFEAKHRFGKELSAVVRNFKNICKTIATRNQLSLAHDLMSHNMYSPLEQLGSGSVEILVNIDENITAIICESLSLEIQDEIYIANSYNFGHYQFKSGSYAIVAVSEEGLEFGKVEMIISFMKCTYFVCRLMRTLYFDEHFHAFAVAETLTLKLVDTKKTERLSSVELPSYFVRKCYYQLHWSTL